MMNSDQHLEQIQRCIYNAQPWLVDDTSTYERRLTILLAYARRLSAAIHAAIKDNREDDKL